MKLLNQILVSTQEAEISYRNILSFAKQLAVLFQDATKQLPQIDATNTQAIQVCEWGMWHWTTQ